MKRHLFGASDQARVIAHLMKVNGLTLDGVWDHNKTIIDFGEIKVQHDLSKGEFGPEDQFHIGVGDNRSRSIISKQIEQDFFSIIHPSAIVESTVKIGAGTAVLAGAVINTDALVGQHCIINTGAVVEHDCILADFVHISPNATLTGRVSVGEGTQVGAGAIVLPGVSIGAWATVGAGCIVLEDIPDSAVVVGNPGRIIKYNN